MPKNLVPWRREWQPTPVFLPGEFYGQRSLVGCSPWGPKESDTTERLTFSFQEFGYVRKRAILSLIYDSLGGSYNEKCRWVVTPWTVALQAPLSMGFSRQEYWSGLLFPSSGDLPGIKPVSPALADGFFITEPPGKPSVLYGFKISHVWAKTHCCCYCC